MGILIIVIFLCVLALYCLITSKQSNDNPVKINVSRKVPREKPIWFKPEGNKFLFDKRGNEVAVSAPVVLNPGNFVVEYQKGSWEIYQVTGAKVRGAKLEKVGCPDILKEPLQRKGIFCW